MNFPSEFAIQHAARAWTFPETSGIEMDTRLATAFARIIDEIKPPPSEKDGHGPGRPATPVVVWDCWTPAGVPDGRYPSVTEAARAIGASPGSVSAALARVEKQDGFPFPFAKIRFQSIARASDYHVSLSEGVRVD